MSGDAPAADGVDDGQLTDEDLDEIHQDTAWHDSTVAERLLGGHIMRLLAELERLRSSSR